MRQISRDCRTSQASSAMRSHCKPLNCQGAVSILLALILSLFAMSNIGIFLYLARWHFQSKTQLRLDRCVAKTALNLRAKLNEIETLNLEMKAVRASIASIPVPGAQESLRATLYALFLRQEWLTRTWDLERARWIGQRGCDQKNDVPWPLPRMPFTRPLPDSLGPKPVDNDSSSPDPVQLKIRLLHPPMGTGAEAFQEQKSNGFKINWQVQWTDFH